jgi:hypothetical protein
VCVCVYVCVCVCMCVWVDVLSQLLQISFTYFTFFVIRNYLPENVNRLVSIMHAQCVFVEARNKSINII